jgi:hypothetical protein
MNIDKLNDLLGRELGRNPYGEPNYQWDWSETLFWPSYATGRIIDKQTDGGLWIMEREYRKDRMCAKLFNSWLVTKWAKPEELTRWQSIFPDADYPARGFRIHTNASLPPWQKPTLDDTEHFIKCIREQTSMTYAARLADMLADQDRKDAAKDREIDDMVTNEFTAFMNVNPGKRGGNISPQSGFGESPVLRKEANG